MITVQVLLFDYFYDSAIINESYSYLFIDLPLRYPFL